MEDCIYIYIFVHGINLIFDEGVYKYKLRKCVSVNFNPVHTFADYLSCPEAISKKGGHVFIKFLRLFISVSLPRKQHESDWIICCGI